MSKFELGDLVKVVGFDGDRDGTEGIVVRVNHILNVVGIAVPWGTQTWHEDYLVPLFVNDYEVELVI